MKGYIYNVTVSADRSCSNDVLLCSPQAIPPLGRSVRGGRLVGSAHPHPRGGWHLGSDSLSYLTGNAPKHNLSDDPSSNAYLRRMAKRSTSTPHHGDSTRDEKRDYQSRGVPRAGTLGGERRGSCHPTRWPLYRLYLLAVEATPDIYWSDFHPKAILGVDRDPDARDHCDISDPRFTLSAPTSDTSTNSCSTTE